MIESLQAYKINFGEIVLLQYLKMVILRNNESSIGHNSTIHKLVIIKINFY